MTSSRNPIDQIPTTVQVRHKFATVLDDTQGWRYSEEWAADFDRWLAEHVAAAVQAERERADRLVSWKGTAFRARDEWRERAEATEAAIERAHAVHREHTNTGLVERCKCLACDMIRALDGTEAAHG